MRIEQTLRSARMIATRWPPEAAGDYTKLRR
jgi:hypothetical protein